MRLVACAPWVCSWMSLKHKITILFRQQVPSSTQEFGVPWHQSPNKMCPCWTSIDNLWSISCWIGIERSTILFTESSTVTPLADWIEFGLSCFFLLQRTTDAHPNLGARVVHTVETVYKVVFCPRGKLLYMRIYLITGQTLLSGTYWDFDMAIL